MTVRNEIPIEIRNAANIKSFKFFYNKYLCPDIHSTDMVLICLEIFPD